MRMSTHFFSLEDEELVLHNTIVLAEFRAFLPAPFLDARVSVPERQQQHRRPR